MTGMPPDAQPRLCPNCKYPSHALNGGGNIYSIVAANWRGLAALIAGQFAMAKCEICEVELDVRDHVMLMSHRPNEAVLLFGTLAAGRETEFLADVQQGLRNQWEIRAVASAEEMQAAAVELVKRKLKPIALAQLADAKGELAAHLKEHWADLSAEEFSAARVTLEVPVAGVRVAAAGADAASVGVADAIRSLAGLQARTWIAMLYAWSGRESRAKTLEEDLRRHIHPAGLVEGAAEEALAMIERLSSGSPNLGFAPRYCLEALRATLYDAAKEENPHATAWAALFLECELKKDEPLIVSAQRAKSTVTFGGLWDAIVQVVQANPQAIKDSDIEGICAKAGHAELPAQLDRGAIRVDTGGHDPVAVAIDFIGFAAAQTGEFVDDVPEALAQPLLEARDAEGLERVANAIAAQRPGDREAEATADAWLGACLNRIECPARYLNRIGDTPREWEHNLPPRLRTRLWLERSNHLRLRGRKWDALQVLETAIDTGGDAIEEASLRVLQRNRAILLRETGSPDAAVAILTGLRKNAEGSERIRVLESLAAAQTALGDNESARQSVAEALAMATGPFAGQKPKLAGMAATLAGADGSIDALLRVDPATKQDASGLLALASAWLNTLRPRKSVPVAAAAEVLDLSKRLTKLVEAAHQQGSNSTAYMGLRLLAEILGIGGENSKSLAVWQMMFDLAEDEELMLDPAMTLALAAAAYREGDPDGGAEMLARTVGANEAAFGGIADLSRALAGSERLKGRLLDVGTAVLEREYGFEHIRLAGEMQRDTLARARSFRSQETTREIVEQFRHGISDEVVARLAPAEGRVAVLEWIETREYITAIVTTIGSDAHVQTEFLKRLDVDLKELSEFLAWRLSTWTRNRKGSPFDVSGWQELQSWLWRCAGSLLQDGDHVVFLEHESAAGIPWHVAVAERWTCSYAPGWVSLLSSAKPAAAGQRIGIAMAPLATDTEEVRAALESSAARTLRFAEEHGEQSSAAIGPSCDRPALERLLGESGILKVLCHGYVQPASYEVAWLVANGMALPSAKAVELGTEQGAAFRFSWRDAAKLERSSGVVFSAACSSGYSHLAGVGERIGLMAGLRMGGTRALVAPRWDVIAAEVLPILDDALERYWKSNRLARSVWEACRAAPAGTPDWIRWAAAVEGDWQ